METQMYSELPVNIEPPSGSAVSPAKRLVSLDALRGFDMLWITGGAALAGAAAGYTEWPQLKWLAGQMRHIEWHGFLLMDLIFPLFIFLSGAAISFSVGRKLEKGISKWKIFRHILQRSILLILFGCIYNGALKLPGWDQVRYASVLGHIGIAYFFAAVIYLKTDVRHRIIWAAGLLLGYFLALRLIAVPGYEAGDFSMAGNTASFIDRCFLPGILYRGIHDPQGIFISVSAISGALLGVLTGDWLRSEKHNGLVKAVGMFIVGAFLVYAARLWHSGFYIYDGLWSNPLSVPPDKGIVDNLLSFPINKEIWTSSFVIYTAGWSLLLLSLFYLIIDVMRLRFLAFFFVVIGMNPITIYMGLRIFNFDHTSNFLFGGVVKLFDPALHDMLNKALYILCWWAVLLFLYRKKIFLRV